MAVEKKRILQLFYIMSDRQEYVRSFELAAAVGVTERTIKSDIPDLDAFAKASGARIRSKKGKGYFLEVIDSTIFWPVKQQLDIKFSTSTVFTNSELQSRTNDILRRIIVEEQFITIDDIAEELYLTKSSIKEEMKEVNRILVAYNLKLKTRPGEGPFVEGKEFDRRMLMIRIFETYYHEAVTLYKYSDYLSYFEREDQERYDIRHVLLKVLRESDCHVADDFTQRISRYLLLLSSRYQDGHPIEFSEEETKFIQSFKQYPVARKIIEELQVFVGYEVDDAEAVALALILLVWDDIDGDSDMEKDYAPVYLEAKEFVQDCFLRIEEEYNINLTQIERSEKILLTIIIPLLIQKKFHCENYSIQQIYSIADDARKSPVSTKLSATILSLFKERYQTTLSLFNLLYISNKIYCIINRIDYDYIPRRALLCSQNGMESSKMLKHDILNRYPGAFETIDPYELYEMRLFKKEDYDCAILSFPYFAYKYDWDYLMVDMIPTEKQMNDIYNNLILKGVVLEPILDSLGFDSINIYRSFQYDSMESFIKLISFKIGQNSKSIKQLEDELLLNAYTSISNKIGFLFIRREYSNNTIFDIYQLEKESSWKYWNVESIIVMTLDFKNTLECLRFLEHLTYQFAYNPEELWLFIENPKKEYLIDLVKQKLKAQAISLTKGKS